MAIKTFTAGSVLTAADTNTYLANGGLVFVKSQAVGTGVATQQVTNAFSAAYENYRILITGVDSNTDGNGVKLKLDGITASVYSAAWTDCAYSAGTPARGGYVNDSGGVFVGTTTTSDDIHCIIDIHAPFVTKRKTYTFQSSSANSITAGGGYINSVLSATGFTIDPDGAATMTGGTIWVYGYRIG